MSHSGSKSVMTPLNLPPENRVAPCGVGNERGIYQSSSVWQSIGDVMTPQGSMVQIHPLVLHPAFNGS